MKRFLLVLIAGSLFLLTACPAKQVPPPQWSYEREAIRLHIRADNKLNLDEGEPHTLLLCVYQLSDPNNFNQLANDEDGIYTLLECGLFGDGASASKRLIIQPGQDVNLTLDRAEGARYVAMVAGYYILEKDRMVRVVEVPETLEIKGFFSKKKTRKPSRISVDLTLGPQQITTVSTETLEGQ